MSFSLGINKQRAVIGQLYFLRFNPMNWEILFVQTWAKSCWRPNGATSNSATRCFKIFHEQMCGKWDWYELIKFQHPGKLNKHKTNMVVILLYSILFLTNHKFIKFQQKKRVELPPFRNPNPTLVPLLFSTPEASEVILPNGSTAWWHRRLRRVTVPLRTVRRYGTSSSWSQLS